MSQSSDGLDSLWDKCKGRTAEIMT